MQRRARPTLGPVPSPQTRPTARSSSATSEIVENGCETGIGRSHGPHRIPGCNGSSCHGSRVHAQLVSCAPLPDLRYELPEGPFITRQRTSREPGHRFSSIVSRRPCRSARLAQSAVRPSSLITANGFAVPKLMIKTVEHQCEKTPILQAYNPVKIGRQKIKMRIDWRYAAGDGQKRLVERSPSQSFDLVIHGAINYLPVKTCSGPAIAPST